MNLVTAILAHRGGPSRAYQASEANYVIDNYTQLNSSQQQDLLNFLRSL